jgi:hypothetical protein
MSMESSKIPSAGGGGVLRQIATLVVGAILFAGLAWVMALSIRAVLGARDADEVLLAGFELFLAVLLLGTLMLVLLGVLIQVLLPGEYSQRAFGGVRLQEIYAHWDLRVYSVESERDHAANPYRDLPDLELCDVAEQVDREAYPKVWADVAHEIKARVETFRPVRIG